MKTPKVPKGARTVRLYPELESYLMHFAEGKEPFLWIVGRPGLSKSESIRRATAKRKVLLIGAGQITPFHFYQQCYLHRGEPIILDDAEIILDAPTGKKLVSALGELSPAKRLFWGSSNRALERDGIPATFYTNSPLCVIANRVTNDPAVMSRGTLLHFAPANPEVHRAVADWFWDQEIHDFIGRNVTAFGPLDVRWYVKASRDKKNRRDWKRILLESHGNSPEESTVQGLEIDPRCLTSEEKVRAFSEATGRSERTYFRIRSRLESQGTLTPPPFVPTPVRGRSPEKIDMETLDCLTEAAARPTAVEEEQPALRVVDVPAPNPREEFTRPAPPRRPLLRPFQADDTTALDRPGEE